MNVNEIYYRHTRDIVSFYFIQEIKEDNLLRKRVSIATNGILNVATEWIPIEEFNKFIEQYHLLENVHPSWLEESIQMLFDCDLIQFNEDIL